MGDGAHDGVLFFVELGVLSNVLTGLVAHLLNNNDRIDFICKVIEYPSVAFQTVMLYLPIIPYTYKMDNINEIELEEANRHNHP